MRTLRYIIAIFALLISCDTSVTVPVSIFDSPFPKKNINLAHSLGNKLIIKRPFDTLTLNIIPDKEKNTIINSAVGDTIFTGKVCKYRGLYYFNLEINKGVYWIYSVKIVDNLIYGFDKAWSQTLDVDSAIISGKNKNLISFFSPDTSFITLHPEKHEMKKLFSSIITKFIPDTIIYYNKAFPTETAESILNQTEIDPEEFNYIQKVYPNPTRDFITVELQQKSKSTFILSNLSGKTVLKGQFNELENKLDLSKQLSGIYALTIINVSDKQKETIKILKIN
jgi:hypothetical protein